MAANKFATMLHRNTNKITLILVYAFLEWVLIFLLLLNSLFSYLIIKFADYFGLQRPCLLCSRLDHLFEPSQFHNSYRSLVCEAHAEEISKLGYCSNHRKLAESQDMCEDCSSSSHDEVSKKFAFFPWMKQLGVVQDCCGEKVSENGNGEVILKCSCCGVNLEKRAFYPDYFLIKPSWVDLDATQKGNLVLETLVNEKINEDEHVDIKISGFENDHGEEEQMNDENREEEAEENCSHSISNLDCKEKDVDDGDKIDFFVEKEQEKAENDDLDTVQAAMVELVDKSKDVHAETQPNHLEFYIDQDDCHLIPIELMEIGKMEVQSHRKREEENYGKEDFVLEFDKHIGTQYELVAEEESNLEEEVPLLLVHENQEESEDELLASRELMEDERFLKMDAKGDLVEEETEEVAIAQATEVPSSDALDVQGSSVAPEGEEMESDNNQVPEEGHDDIEADVSIGTEIPDQEEVHSLYPCARDPTTSNADHHTSNEHGSKKDEEDAVEFRTTTVETTMPDINNNISSFQEGNDIIEEDKLPDTPTSMDSFHHLQKKLLLLERRESSTEESLDGSVFSDIESGDGVLTVEKLKSALRAERKALNALYAELEEERSASAVATNQTMAMINRLQEEKAAMQMEALQYQRMMEEQSAYDQEALQLLNDIMVKREKEKAELEKELEMYRKKVFDYEAKERLSMVKRRIDGSARTGTSSACSSSNAEESDGLSTDLNQESNNQNTPPDAILYLEESLANFEEERVSILGQFRALEEKLYMLSDEEEQHFEDIRPIEYLENGNGYIEHFDHGSEVNGVANGHYKEINGKLYLERKNIGAKAKRLLPLFDATEAEVSEDGELNGHTEEIDSVAIEKYVNRFEMDNNRLAIEEEVDHVYERLQALEADREFLKHCMTSLKKGDKGLELLQEILHHLKDLRSVELRVRNMFDGGLE